MEVNTTLRRGTSNTASVICDVERKGPEQTVAGTEMYRVIVAERDAPNRTLFTVTTITSSDFVSDTISVLRELTHPHIDLYRETANSEVIACAERAIEKFEDATGVVKRLPAFQKP
jgi:hypothetical protein